MSRLWAADGARRTAHDDVRAQAALTDLALSLRAVRRDAAQLARHARVAARQLGGIAAWVSDLPRLSVVPSDGPLGDDLVRGLSEHQPWPFRHRAVAVLPLPTTYSDYLRGRARQALRTNCRRARQAGVTVVLVDDAATSRVLLDELLAGHDFYETLDDRMRRHVRDGRDHLWFALDTAGAPLAMAAVAIDGPVAHLAILQVGSGVAERSAVRYLLSAEVTSGLIEQGVRHLLADSMLLSSPGVVYLQRRLGFEPMNLELPGTARRRLGWGHHDPRAAPSSPRRGPVTPTGRPPRRGPSCAPTAPSLSQEPSS